jgi:hypothetical protein
MAWRADWGCGPHLRRAGRRRPARLVNLVLSQLNALIWGHLVLMAILFAFSLR